MTRDSRGIAFPAPTRGWLDCLVFSWVFNLACSSTCPTIIARRVLPGRHLRLIVIFAIGAGSPTLSPSRSHLLFFIVELNARSMPFLIASLPFDGCCVSSSMCHIPRPTSSDHRPTPHRPRRSLSLSTPSLHPPAPPCVVVVDPIPLSPPPFFFTVESVPLRPSDSPSMMRQGPPIPSRSRRLRRTNRRGRPQSQEGCPIARRRRPHTPRGDV